MPRFEVNGFGELKADLASLAEFPDELFDELLNAEADVVEPAI